MVTVTAYAERETKDGRKFITLELTGGLELVVSSSTGNHYATVRKCSIPSTFGEEIAKSLIGTQLPGEIVRVECEPYEYVKESTGETIMLNYNWSYQAPNQAPVGNSPIRDMEAV